MVNHSSQLPDQIITASELRRNTGERGSRMWIARDGIIYDVTDCPKWRTGLHENLHFAGQDLTSELPEAVTTQPCRCERTLRSNLPLNGVLSSRNKHY